MAESMSAGEASMEDLDNLMQQGSDSVTIFGNTLKEIGIDLLNFGINAAIMAGITLAVKAINDYVHEFENAVTISQTPIYIRNWRSDSQFYRYQ